ncbi:MAG: bifunctional [glutamate--ammonia ligase]-adenylyl-L-tyrosine phosphorylase/[glutamate--ammonia-ligase] adenylyltransferase [Isosphaerales bacterium]
MTPAWFLAYHDIPEIIHPWLAGLGIRDPERGGRDLADLTRRAGPDCLELVARIAAQLDTVLPRCADPGMALANLERFVAALPGIASTLRQLADNPRTTEILLQVFSTSQYFSEVLIRDPEFLDWLRGGPERPDRAALIEDLWNTVVGLPTDLEQGLALRRFRRRESLRIGYNDIIRGFPLELITQDLSDLADACVEVAVRLARSRAVARFGLPTTSEGRAARFVVLGLGKLGGQELNYSSDIDLIFLYDEDGQTNGPRTVSNAELFARVGSDVVRLLADHTVLGIAYRVDMRLRPDGEQGALARPLDATLGYYVTRGRTWERQALIKCRPIAGDLSLGVTFCEAIKPFVYRRYLGAAEIAEIKVLKRRIEQRTVTLGTAEVEVKTGRGGIRDVEFVVQFLQLLHGGDYPDVRHGTTLQAIARLEQLGCLSTEERHIMDDTYRFLRRVEHRLQILFDRQTHQMPRDPEALRTLALRMGYAPASAWEDRHGPAVRFMTDYRSKTELNRRILNHLLHDAFKGDDGAAVDPIVDLVLDPEPSPEFIGAVLATYPFRDRRTAYHNLLALAREDSPFLSQARCRHFMAAIAPRLLESVSRTPDPDMTLTNLEKVSASLGAKAILWELFNFNPPSLRLYVELCATSQFLSEILINNPGMIDDLVDSLVVDRPLPGAAIKAELAELCKGAEDLSPILRSFRNKEWIRIGTRDILAREPVSEVTRELADVAEAIVSQVACDQWRRRAARFGTPRCPGSGRRDRWAILALGKFGGRELNYHSDLDLIFLHEAEGLTAGGAVSISNEQFVTEVAQRLLSALGRGPATGPLYAVDARLRPHGASGPLVQTLHAFSAYYQQSTQTWEKMSLTRARVIFATGGFGRQVTEAVHALLSSPCDPVQLAAEVLAMRRKLDAARSRHDLKRGSGGLADLEFIVQYLVLAHAAVHPDLLRSNFWDALTALRRHAIVSPLIHTELRDAYEFLRMVEGRLRLIHNRSVSELPESATELERLARRLSDESADPARAVQAFLADADRITRRTRELFDEIVVAAAAPARDQGATPKNLGLDAG